LGRIRNSMTFVLTKIQYLKEYILEGHLEHVATILLKMYGK